MKYLIPVLTALSLHADAFAQKLCSENNIYGAWKECGRVQSDFYDHPPDTINSDSLKNAFPKHNDSASAWSFAIDGTYTHYYKGQRNGNGRFGITESNCALKLSTRRRNPMRIVYLDDSCMILWYNNPKTAYLTVYRRAD